MGNGVYEKWENHTTPENLIHLQWFGEGDEGGDDKAPDKEKLEKGWNDAIAEMRKSFGDEPEEKAGKEDLRKASKDEDDSDSDEGEASDSDESPPPKSTKKSLADEIAELDPEAEAAMDIEPYLKSFAVAVDEKITSSTADIPELRKAVKELTKMVKVLGKAVLVGTEMQKSTREELGKIGELDIPSMSRLRKSRDRFEVDGTEKMSRTEVLSKAMELQGQGKLSFHDVTLLEGRLNAGGDIPEAMKPLFRKEAK